MLRKLLFFSKYDGDKTNEKLNEILENQKNILDKIEKLEIKSLEIQKIMYEEIKKISSEISKNEKAQEKVLLKCSFLLEKQEKDNENIYGIVNQLLLKDLLKAHKNAINEILSENKEEKSKFITKKPGLFAGLERFTGKGGYDYD